jgi:hypothetical protein
MFEADRFAAEIIPLVDDMSGEGLFSGSLPPPVQVASLVMV